jgi:hypothetical protein
MIYYDIIMIHGLFSKPTRLDLKKLGWFLLGQMENPTVRQSEYHGKSHAAIKTLDRHWANPPCSGQEQSPGMGSELSKSLKNREKLGKYDIYDLFMISMYDIL